MMISPQSVQCNFYIVTPFVDWYIPFDGSTEAPSNVFLLFFLFSDWLKSNHLRTRIGRGFLDIFRAIFVALRQKRYE